MQSPHGSDPMKRHVRKLCPILQQPHLASAQLAIAQKVHIPEKVEGHVGIVRTFARCVSLARSGPPIIGTNTIAE